MIAGNKTLEAASNNGHRKIRVVPTDGSEIVVVQRTDLDLNSAKARELAIADNRTAELDLEWNPDVLKDLDVDLSQFWNENELRKLVPGPEIEAPEPQLDKAAELQKKWKTARGQIWEIGAHRLMCGDSTSGDVAVLMGDCKANIVYTDPPYGVDYDGGTTVREKLTGDRDTTLYTPTCAMAAEHSHPKASLYLWHAGVKGFAAAAAAAGWVIRCELVWSKNLAQFGALSAQYHQKHEPAYYCHKKGEAPAWYGPTNEVTIWDCDRSRVNEHHPTQKPPELAARAMRNSSQSGDIVLDLFLGSASTMVAAEVGGRICYGMEIEPKYVAVSLERLSEMGLQPKLISSEQE